MGKINIGMIVDTTCKTFLPFENAITKLRGLAVTVDGVHFNSS